MPKRKNTIRRPKMKVYRPGSLPHAVENSPTLSDFMPSKKQVRRGRGKGIYSGVPKKGLQDPSLRKY